jgi:hypothetical protein
MGKIAFVLGLVGSVVLGFVASGKLVHRDYSASVVKKLGTHTTCPTFWVSWDKPPDLVWDGLMACKCPDKPQPEESGTPMHPPKEVHDAAAPMDVMTISYTEYTSLGGTKTTGLSYTLARGSDRQSFQIQPGSGPYTSFAMTVAIPLVVGIVAGILLGFLPKKKGASD